MNVTVAGNESSISMTYKLRIWREECLLIRFQNRQTKPEEKRRMRRQVRQYHGDILSRRLSKNITFALLRWHG